MTEHTKSIHEPKDKIHHTPGTMTVKEHDKAPVVHHIHKTSPGNEIMHEGRSFPSEEHLTKHIRTHTHANTECTYHYDEEPTHLKH
jgi:hypothetical protein